ncbi:MAG TPA: EF-Tu/IF-2/RF-3 family GTPase, partial [Ignavibacteriaceae bacterium]
YIAPVEVCDLQNPMFKDKLGEENYLKFAEELEMLDTAGEDFSRQAVIEGRLTPVFFGSAMNNFGVQLLLDGFLDYAVPPAPRKSKDTLIKPEDDTFSGFIFKIQANMDPKHRDRIAFMRVCSGRFERDMQAFHSNSGRKIRLSNSQKLFGQERETVNEAYAGDIVGFVGNSNFGIGDTIAEDQSVLFSEIPHFAPEHFVFMQNPNPSDYKKFRDGLDQLLQEGVIQAFYIRNAAQKIPLLGAVGPLQFEVVQYRLENEYGAKSRLEQTNWKVLRWFSSEITEEELNNLVLPAGASIAVDKDENRVILFTSEYSMGYFSSKYPDVELGEVPVETGKKEMKRTG